MSNFILGFLVGGILMDTLWAWRTGLLKAIWQKIFHQNEE